MRWSDAKRRALGELIGLPPRPKADATTERASAPIAEVRRVLELPEPPAAGWRRSDRWLCGGSVAGWLLGGYGERGKSDWDFFFPSIESLEDMSRQLFASDATFRCFRSHRTICQTCGRPAQLVRVDAVDDLSFGLPRIRCVEHGEHGGVEAAQIGPDRLVRLSPELIAASRMVCLELRSPDDRLFQLVTAGFGATPHEALRLIDITITQFGLDDQNLYFLPNSWTDFLRRHLRMRAIEGPTLRNCSRMWKYMRRGFRPSPGTFVRFHAVAILRALRSKDSLMLR